MQNQNTFKNQSPYGVRPPENSLAKASKVCSIVGIVTFFFVFPGIIFGSLGIILGLLSRGGRKKTNGSAKVGVTLGAIALVLTIVITAMAIYVMIRTYGSFQNYLDYYQDIVNSYTNSYTNPI